MSASGNLRIDIDYFSNVVTKPGWRHCSLLIIVQNDAVNDGLRLMEHAKEQREKSNFVAQHAEQNLLQ
jgi:hypothetical protein